MEQTIKIAEGMIRVAITGPESSGKTTLAKALAEELRAGYIPEFVRQYFEENGLEYDQPDLDEIAEGQLELIQLSQDSTQIVDSDFVVLKVWSEHKYDFASSLINARVSENHFDLHILCAPDIPWEPDPMRESPENRHELFEKYLHILNTFKKDFIIVTGAHEERLKKSLDSVRALK